MHKPIRSMIVIFFGLVFFRLFLNFPHVAGDLNYSFSEEIADQINIPQMWQIRGSAGMGENAVSIMWQWPLTFIYSLITYVGMPYNVTLMIFGYLIVIVVSFFSILKIAEKIKLNEIGKLASILIYVVNTYLLLLLDGGQLSIALAYSLFPLSYFLFVESLEKNIRHKLLAGIVVTVLGFMDIRFVYLLMGLLFIRFLFFDFELNVVNLRNRFIMWFQTTSVLLIIFLTLNAYWILPSIMAKPPSLPEGYQEVSQSKDLSFANIGHSITLLQPHWYKNVFGKTTSLLTVFFILPILAFAAPILNKRNREMKFWLIVSLAGIFLTKGGGEPFGSIYLWAFEHIPGFSMFRDSTKFFVYVAFSYSILIGYFVNAFTERLTNSYKNLGLTLISVYLLFLTVPVWSGSMTGTFSTPAYSTEYENIQSVLQVDDRFGRVFWLPSKTSIGFSSPTHPSVESSRVFSKRPFSSGVVGNYETNNFLREANYMGELFDVFGIKYIAYPYPDTRREDLKKDNIDYYFTFFDQISNFPWVKKNISGYPIALFEVKNSQDRFFLADNTWIVSGSDSVYNEFIDGRFGKLNKNALVFVEDTESGFRNIKPNFAKVILNKREIKDFTLSTLPREYFIDPSRDIPKSPNNTGWNSGWWRRDSKDFLWLRNFMQNKYNTDFNEFDFGAGYSISEGNHKLILKSNKIKKDDLIFVRLLNTKKAGMVQFYQKGDKLSDPIYTNKDCVEKTTLKLTGSVSIPDQTFNYDCSYLFWAEVGIASKDGELEIETWGEVNILNVLISIPQNIFDYKLKESIGYDLIDMKTMSKIDFENMFQENYNTEVLYERISSSHYKVQIKGLLKPSTLVFSETYDPLWSVYDEEGNEFKPYKVYNLVNGFYIEKNGVYDVYFTPQKYVNYGFIVSVLSLALLAVILAINKR